MLVVSLGLLYGNRVALETLEPLLALSSISVLAAVALVFVLLAKFGATSAR